MRTLLFDTETTDLISNSLLSEEHQPRVIEFYGVVIEDDTDDTIAELEFMANPGIRLDPKVTQITGIETAQLADKPPFGMFLPEIEKLMKQAQCVVAHNLSYDFEVVSLEFKRAGIEGFNIPWPKIRVCTVQETEWYKGFRLNLNGLHEHLFGEPFSGAHRARTDVEALRRCWMEMKRRGDV